VGNDIVKVRVHQPKEKQRVPKTQEAIGIFFDVDHLKEAIEALVAAGFDRSEVGLLAGARTVRQALGEFYTQTNQFADDPKAPCTAFVANRSNDDTFHALLGGLFFYGATTAAGAAVASAAILGGAVVAAASGVAAIGAAGAIMGLLIHKSDSEFLDEHVDAGHLLLFVRANEPSRGDKAVQILSEHGAYAPKVYTVEACR
jgi:hypothetical protein